MFDFFGFLIYLISLCLLFISVFLINYKLNKYIAIVILLGIIFIASLRGTAGIDTKQYIFRFENINSFSDITLYEPIIPFLMWIVKSLGGSFPVFSLIYGIILIILYCYIFSNFKNSIYFGISIFPVIFLDSLFNGIRIGLAYPLIILYVTSSSFYYFLLSFLSHVSSLIGVIFLKRKIIYLFLFLFIILILSGSSILNIVPDRYINKYYQYKNLKPRFSYAGISDSIALIITLIVYFRVSGVRGKKMIKNSTIVIIFIIIYWFFLVRNFVFLLRVTRLIIIIIFAVIAKRNRKLDKISVLLSFIFGLFYSANFLRQIIASSSYAERGFLPLFPLDWDIL